MSLFRRKRSPSELAGPARTVEEMMSRAAADFVEAVDGPGSVERDPAPAGELDYSRASLDRVDEILDRFHTNDHPLPPDVHFQASAYVFEVARREFGGRYLAGGGDDPYVLVIGEPAFQVGVMVMGKVAGRVINGPEDSIPFFYDGIRPLVDRGVDATLV